VNTTAKGAEQVNATAKRAEHTVHHVNNRWWRAVVGIEEGHSMRRIYRKDREGTGK
jgi:hypothetical protein